MVVIMIDSDNDSRYSLLPWIMPEKNFG